MLREPSAVRTTLGSHALRQPGAARDGAAEGGGPGTVTTQADVAPAPVEAAAALGDALVDAWGSWGPNMTPDARQVAFISDRSGVPQLYIKDVVLDGQRPVARHVKLSDDPVVSVRWAADSGWLTCEVATDGGVRTAVWVEIGRASCRERV